MELFRQALQGIGLGVCFLLLAITCITIHDSIARWIARSKE